ncbi:MAG TPA: WxL domain-containing protein [Chloroflexota bacterium]|nr:WxL domain-containing protein [Chloroflexota bacterium]
MVSLGAPRREAWRWLALAPTLALVVWAATPAPVVHANHVCGHNQAPTCTPTPLPTATPTPTRTSTPSSTPTRSITPPPTVSHTPTAIATTAATATPIPATSTPAAVPSATPTPSPVATPIPTVTETPTPAGPKVLTVSGGAPGAVSATLAGIDQALYATLGAITVTDSTSSGAGWRLLAQATQLTCAAGSGACPAGGDALPTGSVAIAPPTVACSGGRSCAPSAVLPSVTISGVTSIDVESGVRIASAAAGTGDGTYVFTPGDIGGVAGRHLQLTLPAYAYAATYSSTLTFSVAAGP